MRIKIVFLSFVFVLAATVSGQVTYESFYSRLGIGDRQDLGSMQVIHGGSLFSTYRNQSFVNHKNPASYGYLSTTALDLDYQVNTKTTDIGDASNSVWQGNIQMISLAMPLINPLNKLLDRERSPLRIGMNLALMPYTRVGYRTDVLDSLRVTDDLTTNYIRQYAGTGGITKFIGGFGAKYEDFSFGVNMGYLFGRLENQQANLFGGGSSVLNSFDNNIEDYSGFYYDVGGMYDHYLERDADNSSNNRYLTFGFTFHGNHKARITSDQGRFLLSNDFPGLDNTDQDIVFRDTISINTVTNDLTLPSKLGIGVAYNHKNKWRVGVDFEREAWSNYENEARPEDLKDAIKLSAGFEYVPDESSYTSNWKRIRFRSGIEYRTDPRSDNGVQLKTYEVNGGLGIPVVFSRQISFINLGIGYNHLSGDVISENTLRFDFGVTLNNNLWFYKRRFE